MTRHQVDTDTHAAIMAVIARETETFVAQDYDQWAECWVQDERTKEVCISPSFGSTVLEGWDTLSAYMRNVIESGAVCKMADIERLNTHVSVSGKLAHVVFDEKSTHAGGRVEMTFETRVLERSGGAWRILYASFVMRGHQQIDEERLAVSADGEILCAPDTARAILDHHPGLTISNNRLRARNPRWHKTLKAGLESAAARHGFFQHYRYTSERGQNFRLPLVLGETDDGRVAVCVLFVRDGITFVETRADGDLDARLSIAKLVFGLSDGQMALAQRIALGENLTMAASDLGITVNTARTHLSRIYAKTGVNSQTALVRTLLSVG